LTERVSNDNNILHFSLHKNQKEFNMSNKDNDTNNASNIREVAMSDIKRPVAPVLDEDKVCTLMESINKVCIVCS
jgi:hypothetical protein